jgi:hypothetical protein
MDKRGCPRYESSPGVWTARGSKMALKFRVRVEVPTGVTVGLVTWKIGKRAGWADTEPAVPREPANRSKTISTFIVLRGIRMGAFIFFLLF